MVGEKPSISFEVSTKDVDYTRLVCEKRVEVVAGVVEFLRTVDCIHRAWFGPCNAARGHHTISFVIEPNHVVVEEFYSNDSG